MEETQYGIIEAQKPEFPIIRLFKVPHKSEDLIVAYPAFGPDNYLNNLANMQKTYFHSKEFSKISFKEPTTSESISAAAYDFENLAKPQIFDPRWFQAGRIVRTSEGVFANPPKDEKGNLIIDEKILKSYLNGVEPVKVGKGNIYVVSDSENLKDFGFADYDSFTRGIQDRDTFSQGGLARILEHTEEESKNLRIIASPKFYKRGVNVFGFDDVKGPVLRVAGLGSGRGLGDGRLGVDGDGWGGDGGFAFGVLDKSAEGASQKS